MNLIYIHQKMIWNFDTVSFVGGILNTQAVSLVSPHQKKVSWYDIKQHLMVRLQFWKSGEFAELIHSHYSQVHSDTEWWYFSLKWLIGLVSKVFANGPGDRGSIPGRVIPKTFKMVMIPLCLTLSIIRYVSRVKWSNPRKGVAPYSTPRCSSYWKGSLLVALDYSCHLYLCQIDLFKN